MAEGQKRKASGAAIASGGAVTAGVGLAAGGIPGTRPNGNAVFNMTRGEGEGLHRVASAVRGNLPVANAVHGGILGFRGSIHHLGNHFFEEQAKLDEKAKRPTEPRKQAFYRGYNAGKVAPEKSMIRGLSSGRKVANAALVAGLGATGYGIYRAKTSGKSKLKKSDRSQEYNGALFGAGTTGAVVAQGGSKYLTAQQRKFTGRAAAHVDEAGALAPKLAGRHGQKLTLSQMSRHQRKNPGQPYPKTMYPVVRDGEINRNPRLLSGVTHETAEKVGQLRGAAAQERHFAEVLGRTSKVVRGFRVPAAVVGAAGAGGLIAHHRKDIAKGAFSPFGIEHSISKARMPYERIDVAVNRVYAPFNQKHGQRLAADQRQMARMTSDLADIKGYVATHKHTGAPELKGLKGAKGTLRFKGARVARLAVSKGVVSNVTRVIDKHPVATWSTVAGGLTAGAAGASVHQRKKMGKIVQVPVSTKEALLNPRQADRKIMAGAKHRIAVERLSSQLAQSTGLTVRTRYGTTYTPQKRSAS